MARGKNLGVGNGGQEHRVSDFTVRYLCVTKALDIDIILLYSLRGPRAYNHSLSKKLSLVKSLMR